jgi:hypothetical protein
MPTSSMPGVPAGAEPSGPPTTPIGLTPPPPSGTPQGPGTDTTTGQFWKRPWFLAALAIIVLGAIAAIVIAASSDDDDEDAASPATTAELATPTTVEETDVETTDPPATTAASNTTAATTPATTGAPATSAAATTTVAPATTAPGGGGPSGAGTRTDPFSWGTPAAIGTEWQVAVLDVDLDATDTVTGGGSTNNAPPAGSKYVVIRVNATYTGAATGSPYFDLSVGVVDATETEYDDTGCTAVLEDDMVSAPNLGPGESAEGTFCMIVPDAVGVGSAAFARPNGLDQTTNVFWVST